MPIAYSVRKVYKPLNLINVHVYKSNTCNRYYYKKRNALMLKKLNTGSVNQMIKQLLLSKN